MGENLNFYKSTLTGILVCDAKCVKPVVCYICKRFNKAYLLNMVVYQFILKCPHIIKFTLNFRFRIICLELPRE